MEFMMGLCHGKDDFNAMKEMGVEWTRIDCPYPFSDKTHTELTAKYIRFRDQVNAYLDNGYEIFGVTPHPSYLLEFENVENGSQEFNELYMEACKYIAIDYNKEIKLWQIANELNIPLFRQLLSEKQSIEFLKYGGKGIKDSGVDCKICVNMGGIDDSAIAMYKALYPTNEIVEFDYIATDGYPGSWEEGGPDSWIPWIEMLHNLAKKPIIVAEFGYSSYGDLFTEEEFAEEVDTKEIMDDFKRRGMYLDPEISERNLNVYKLVHKMHKYKKWMACWDKGHSPEEQARYLELTYKFFIDNEHVIGGFWYNLDDSLNCYACGKEKCPCETAWGLLTHDHQRKPSFFSYKKMAEYHRNKK